MAKHYCTILVLGRSMDDVAEAASECVGPCWDVLIEERFFGIRAYLEDVTANYQRAMKYEAETSGAEHPTAVEIVFWCSLHSDSAGVMATIVSLLFRNLSATLGAEVSVREEVV